MRSLAPNDERLQVSYRRIHERFRETQNIDAPVARPIFRRGGRFMLNLSQRLILGCAVLVGLIAGLVLATRHALVATGQSRLAFVVLAAAVVVAPG